MTYRRYCYTYQAILDDGSAVPMGECTSETFDNGGRITSQFGEIAAEYEETFGYDDGPMPEDLVRIVEPDKLHLLWDEQDCSADKRSILKMLRQCGIPDIRILGFIITVAYESRWEKEWTETTIVRKGDGR